MRNRYENGIWLVVDRWAIVVTLLIIFSGFDPETAFGQTTTFFPGKVNVRSTATQGVCVGASANINPATCLGDVESQTFMVKGPAPKLTLFDTDGTETFEMFAGTDVLTLQNTSGTSPRIQMQHSLDRIFLTAADVQITSTGSAGLNMANSSIVFQNAAASANGASIGAASNLLILSTATGGMQINNQNNTTALFAMGNTGTGTWNAQQRFPTGSAGAPGIANASAGTTGFMLGGGSIDMSMTGTQTFSFSPFGMTILSFDNGALGGRKIYLGRNTNAITSAAAQLVMEERDGTVVYTWYDATDNLRLHNVAPESAGDTAGIVVGTQTSTRASKNIFGRNTDTRAALDRILRTPVFDFEYKSGAYNRTQFRGITTDDSPEYGMDAGRSFNPVSAFGDTVLAIQEMQREIAALKKEIATLKRRR